MSEAMERPQEEQDWGSPANSGYTPAPAPPPPAGPVVSYCRVCGRGLTAAEAVQAQGAVYCAEHAPVSRESPGPGVPRYAPAGAASPALAFLLGLIPGVGAVYNAQYVKAIVHVVVFGLLISIVSSGSASSFEPLFALLIGLWYLYMPFEAYHTAGRRIAGLPVDDVSSLFPMRTSRTGFPIGPIALIVLGVIFLLAQFDLISFGTLLRYWPVLLIAAGLWMLYERIASRNLQP